MDGFFVRNITKCILKSFISPLTLQQEPFINNNKNANNIFVY